MAFLEDDSSKNHHARIDTLALFHEMCRRVCTHTVRLVEKANTSEPNIH